MINAHFKKKITTSNGDIVLDIKLNVRKGEFVSLFGPSGAGKTTILRIIAGLTEPSEGTIEVGGQLWYDSQQKIHVVTQQRSIGFVFQQYNLFPNMTLKDNLIFALDKNQSVDIVDHFLSVTQLEKVKDLKPAQLSGGQQQRAALIRALMRKPKILLLDEPFSSLDLTTRWALQEELMRIQHKEEITTIFVSHDVVDVTCLSKKILVLDNGQLVENTSFKYPPQLPILSNDK